MSDLINRQEVYLHLQRTLDATDNDDPYSEGFRDGLSFAQNLDGIPTVSAEPLRHGKWIDIDTQMYTWKVRCDQCGHERSMMSTQGRYPKYCENCGAKMDERKEE